MNDPQFYLWMSYGATALALMAEVVALRVARRRAHAAIDEERALEAQD
jgi:heme exporter protein CcmD